MICKNNNCNKKVKEDYLYCYECNLNNKIIYINKCKHCNKSIKKDFKVCYECNLNNKISYKDNLFV